MTEAYINYLREFKEKKKNKCLPKVTLDDLLKQKYLIKINPAESKDSQEYEDKSQILKHFIKKYPMKVLSSAQKSFILKQSFLSITKKLSFPKDVKKINTPFEKLRILKNIQKQNITYRRNRSLPDVNGILFFRTKSLSSTISSVSDIRHINLCSEQRKHFSQELNKSSYSNTLFSKKNNFSPKTDKKNLPNMKQNSCFYKVNLRKVRYRIKNPIIRN